jgi:tetratricopeptide (TPR) repeat protein/transcriptional regulator with XRE-family HTH domain
VDSREGLPCSDAGLRATPRNGEYPVLRRCDGLFAVIVTQRDGGFAVEHEKELVGVLVRCQHEVRGVLFVADALIGEPLTSHSFPCRLTRSAHADPIVSLASRSVDGESSTAEGDRERLTLARARRRAGLSQEELAERCGVSVRSISDIERGVVRRARRGSLTAIADALGLDESARAALFAQHRGAALVPVPVPVDNLPAAAANPVPGQLPPDLARFTGRSDHLDRLDAWLATESTGVRIVSVDGTAGVGKTTLAVHWAHRVRERFPDGQLYADLRGFGPTEPMDTESLLAQLLLGIGVPADRIPPGLEARAGLFRTRTADLRLLVLFDDVARPDQIRAALPAGDGCLVVATSRSQLRGLAVREGAYPLAVNELTDDEALVLLSRIIGEDRVRAERTAARRLVRLCAGLPLAVAILADRAARLPAQRLGRLADEVADEATRLGALRGGPDDVATDLSAVFSWSYRTLPPESARLFRLLGLHPGADFDRAAAAALGEVDLAGVGVLLDDLLAVHLLEQRVSGRYRFHELLRLYAAQLAARHDDPSARRAALARLFDHYRHTAAVAMDALHPHERQRRPVVPARAGCPLPPDDRAAARVWLDTERPVLTGIVAYCATHGWPEVVADLAGLLWRYLDSGAHYREAIAIHEHALATARETGNRAAEGDAAHNLGAALWRSGSYDAALTQLRRALDLRREVGNLIGAGDTLTNLSGLHWRLARYEQAADYLRSALEIRRELGNRSGEAGTLDNLGVIYERLGRYPDALAHHRQALEIFRAAGNRSGEAAALDNVGVVHQRLGAFAEAIQAHRQALDICQEVGTRVGEGYVLTNLGTAYSAAGDHQQAVSLLETALDIRVTAGDRAGEATVLSRLGTVRRRLGEPIAAVRLHERALEIAAEIGDEQVQTEALNSLGDTRRATNDPRAALDCHRRALEVATFTGDRYEQAHAYEGVGHALAATGDPARARREWARALEVYTALGSPAATAVSILLSEVN